jgi:hypothetical protein
LFQDDTCKIFEHDVSLTSFASPFSIIKKSEDNLYHTPQFVESSPVQTYFAKRQINAQSSSIWHQRLAHLNDKDLGRLAENPDSGIKISPTIGKIPCEECIPGKMSREKFHSADRPPERLNAIEISVIELGGRLQTSSI